MTKIVNSPQYSNGKFHNHINWEQPSLGEYLGTMWDFIFKGNNRTPEDTIPSQKIDFSKFSNSGTDQLNATWIGHSSLMINIDGIKILTDPVYEKRVSFFGPSRFNGEIPFDVDEIPEIDVAIISHNHYDHLNKYSIKQIAQKTKLFVVPLGVGAELENWDIPRNKIKELDWWEELSVSADLKIIATPAQHFSGRGLTDRDETLWASWVIEGQNHKVFFSGDGGYSKDFKAIGEKYGPFHMTFLECGAYNEKWHHIHMYPEETLQAHLDLMGEILHPIHWATFNLSLHPWYEPIDRLVQAAWSANVKLALPIVGETTEYGKYIPNRLWWDELKDYDTELVTD